MVAGELTTVGSAEWVVRIKNFIVGDIGTLVAFIDRFGASPASDRYVLINALGDGRSLADAPTLTTSGDAHSVHCPVAPGFPRKDVRHLNMTATSPETNDLLSRTAASRAFPAPPRCLNPCGNACRCTGARRLFTRIAARALRSISTDFGDRLTWRLFSSWR